MVKEETVLWDAGARRLCAYHGASATFDGVFVDVALDVEYQRHLLVEEDGLSEVSCPETAADGRSQDAAKAADHWSMRAGNSGDKSWSSMDSSQHLRFGEALKTRGCSSVGTAQSLSAATRRSMISAVAFWSNGWHSGAEGMTNLVLCCFRVEHGEKHITVAIALGAVGGQNFP